MISCKLPRTSPCVGIFSPSEPVTTERQERFEKGIQVLHDHGLRTKLADGVFAQRYYMAGSAYSRASDIMALISDPEVDVLWASWGGKSCNQLLRFLDFKKIAEAQKPIFAFSDGCVLLNAITAKTGLFTFSGPNVVGKAYETLHSSLDVLSIDYYANKMNLLGDVSCVDSKILRSGTGEGRVQGGNLSTFVLGLLGSQYMPIFEDVIFFWESAGETPQIVDQFLTCLVNAKFFDHVRGMVIGDFIREEPADYKQCDPFEMILEVLDDYEFPILYCPTFGHLGHLENPVFPIGVMSRLDTKTSYLMLLEQLVEVS